MTGIHRMKAGLAKLPEEQFVGVSLNNHVYAWSSGGAKEALHPARQPVLETRMLGSTLPTQTPPCANCCSPTLS